LTHIGKVMAAHAEQCGDATAEGCPHVNYGHGGPPVMTPPKSPPAKWKKPARKSSNNDDALAAGERWRQGQRRPLRNNGYTLEEIRRERARLYGNGQRERRVATGGSVRIVRS
jgi:hypothetical protein